MKLSKNLGDILYSLFGPNGSNQIISDGQKQQFAVYKELERHGIVKLTPKEGYSGVFNVIRN